MCCGCSEKFLLSSIVAQQESEGGKRGNSADCLSLDLRGTGSVNQPEFLHNLPDSVVAVSQIEILTCDEGTPESIREWVNDHGFAIQQIEQENGYQRIILCKVIADTLKSNEGI